MTFSFRCPTEHNTDRRTVKTNKKRCGLFLRRRRLVATGSYKFDHVTDRPVDVALAPSAVGTQRHVAAPVRDVRLVAVDQVAGTRSAAVGVVGVEVGDRHVEVLSRLSVDDPRLSQRSTRRTRHRARHVSRAANAAHWNRATALCVRHCNKNNIFYLHFIFIKRFKKRQKVVTSEVPCLPISGTHCASPRQMARLSGPEWPG